MNTFMRTVITALLLGLPAATGIAAEPEGGEYGQSMHGGTPAVHGQPFLLAQSGPSRSREYLPSPVSQPNEAKMRQWIFGKIRKDLGINDATAKRFEPVFMKYTTKRRALEKRQHALVRQIDKAANETTLPDKQISALSRQYREIEREIASEREQFYKQAEKILNARQMARLVISEDKMKEDLFKRVRKERGAMNINKGPQEDSPPPPDKQ